MNVRLQHPPNKLKELEIFSVFLKDTSDINLQMTASKIEYIFYFIEGTKQDITEFVYFDKIRSKPHFFSIALPEIDNNEFKPITVEYYDLEKCSIDKVEIKKINLVDQLINTVNVEFDFDIPATKDFLSSFIPSVLKIDLLNNCDLLVPSQINKHINDAFPIQFDTCTIKKINRLSFSYDFPILSYTDFNIDRKKIFSISTSEIIAFKELSIENVQPINQFRLNDKIVYDNLIENYTEINNQKNLFEILDTTEKNTAKPVNVRIPGVKESPGKDEKEIKNILLRNSMQVEIIPSPSVKIEIKSDIPLYLKEGAEFLLNSKLAFFYDEFELGKELQAVIALKNLIVNNILKKVLIITEQVKNRFVNLNADSITSGLWQNNFSLYAPDIQFQFHETLENINKTDDLRQNPVTGLTYDVYEECCNTGILSREKLNLYDCIILDDVSKTTFLNESSKCIYGKIDSSYLWILSDFDNPSLSDKIKQLFPNKTVDFFGRKKNSSGIISPLIQSYNIFLELDEQNIFLADRIYNDGRKKLEELLTSGNLSRIIPNAAQTVQEMQRLTNFILGTNSGNKTNLLRYHLDRVLDRNNRILIYSQFDAMGLTKIQDILNEIGIRFIKISFTDSPQDIQKKINGEINANEKLIYLANINPKTIKLNFPEVSHLINFDNWWNPVTRRTIGEKLISNNGKSITVYNYFYKNTLESQLFNEMTSSGITDKSLPDNLSAENFNQIFDEKSWCRIFNLSEDFSSYGKIDDISVNENKGKVSE